RAGAKARCARTLHERRPSLGRHMQMTTIRTALLMTFACVACSSEPATSGEPDNGESARELEQSVAPLWTGTWSVSPQSGNSTFNQQTLRQIVRTSISGSVA